jgi:hypothetical protein
MAIHVGVPGPYARRLLEQRPENRGKRLRQDRMAPLRLKNFTEDFWRVSEMIADASREGVVSAAFERDYQLLRLSYNAKWALLQKSLDDTRNHGEEFMVIVAASTLSEAIQGNFWEHYERMHHAGEVLSCWENQLNK